MKQILPPLMKFNKDLKRESSINIRVWEKLLIMTISRISITQFPFFLNNCKREQNIRHFQTKEMKIYVIGI